MPSLYWQKETQYRNEISVKMFLTYAMMLCIVCFLICSCYIIFYTRQRSNRNRFYLLTFSVMYVNRPPILFPFLMHTSIVTLFYFSSLLLLLLLHLLLLLLLLLLVLVLLLLLLLVLLLLLLLLLLPTYFIFRMSLV